MRHYLDYFNEISRSLIEILILSAFIYFGWKQFRGTRGAKVLIGFGLVLATLTIAAIALHLRVIELLLQQSSQVLVLALTVIFHPELRRYFAEWGSRPLIGVLHQQTEVIEAVISALDQLRQDGHGALIAFEQEVVYEPARETGTMIDARVSPELLATIFFTKTPLHDGGVIIVRERVLLAAAVFPLTQAEGLQRTLGLRHRAALGLSDETDSAVVVLSEETGIVSLAYRGKLYRPLTNDELRAQLVSILVQGK